VLLGHANWWLPKWLDRIMPHLEIEGETGLPPVEPVEPITTTTFSTDGKQDRVRR